ncbi:RNA polymerase sigma-70 factor [Niabella sp. CC-SYL272]|uniref:RNA polymerase sigma factor n=1 Tax=Niabella agricola TaxID=2891571 RepID=UPI001F2AFC45|nr:RNA polymerase sigma-70 factor [Niabella agricola]MCF3110451.1 RNA polymerase sigma-70 factor [Niabella agricola]
MQEWLQLIAEGNEGAFRQLFDAYRPRMYTYLLRITGSEDVAEDSVQDIFLKLWKDRARLAHIENFNAYLHRMAQNQAYSRFRSLAKEALILAELKDNTFSPRHPEHELVFKEVREQIIDLISQLSPQQRSVFLLSREAGLKHEEIARKMGITVLTVKKHMSVALRTLRKEIANGYSLLILFLIKY